MTFPLGFYNWVITPTDVIDFNIDFVAGNSIVATVNGTPLAPVLFNTNQATTISDLATAIAGAPFVTSATVTGPRQITVLFNQTQLVPSIGLVYVVDSVVTTGGASQPTATFTDSLPSLAIGVQDNLTFDDGATYNTVDGGLWIGSSTGNPAAATIAVSNGIEIVNGTNSISLSFNAAGSMDPYFVVDNTNTPYVVNTATNYYLACDTTVSAITLKLPDTPTNGDSFVVKDYLGNAAVRNITITTVSGVTLIDAAASYVISTNYESVQIFGGSGKWQIF